MRAESAGVARTAAYRPIGDANLQCPDLSHSARQPSLFELRLAYASKPAGARRERGCPPKPPVIRSLGEG